jgi:hypothetical protein
MTSKPYDTTVAIMAATLYGQLRLDGTKYGPEDRTRLAVARARAIVAEVQRTEPEKASDLQ